MVVVVNFPHLGWSGALALEGLLQPVQSLIDELDLSGIDEAIETFAQGRMKKKLLGTKEALEDGVETVVLGDGRIENPVTAALGGAGTVIRQKAS